MAMEKIRQSNFELMRIISMFFIVVWHIIVHGGLLYNTTGFNHFLIQLILCIIVVHVNSFILISGYFQYKKSFSLRKFFSVFNAAWFYKACIMLIFVIFGIITISKWDFVETILPIDIGYWFIATYLALYVLSPFLNKIINNVTKKEFQKLLLILFILLSLLPFITKQEEFANNGSNIISFIMLYFMGAYLSKFPIRKEKVLKNISNFKYKMILLVIIFLMIVINLLYWKFADYFDGSANNFISYLCDVYKNSHLLYNNPVIIIQSICYFLLFSTFNFKNRFINNISPLMFGIYLIHDNRNMRVKIYDWLNVTSSDYYGSVNLLLYIFITAIFIFVVGALIEFVRQKIVNLICRKFLFRAQIKVH